MRTATLAAGRRPPAACIPGVDSCSRRQLRSRRRTGPVAGQPERPAPSQLASPVFELPEAAGIVGEGPFPPDVAAVGDGGGQAGRPAVVVGPVGGGQLAQQQGDGRTVGDDVVPDQHETMPPGPDPVQLAPPQRAARHVQRPVGGGRRQLASSGFGGVDHRQPGSGRRGHPLQRLPADRQHRGTQRLVPGHELGERGVERFEVQRPVDVDDAGEVIRGRPRHRLVGQPQPLLRRGQREHVGPREPGGAQLRQPFPGAYIAGPRIAARRIRRIPIGGHRVLQRTGHRLARILPSGKWAGGWVTYTINSPSPGS